MRIAGIVLMVAGVIGTLVFGIQAIQETETFSFLGLDIGVSGANWGPVIVSIIVLVIGLVLMNVNKKTLSN